MKKCFLLGAVATAMMFTGCGISSHLTHNQNIYETNVQLAQSNFEVKREVKGHARSTYVLGIGGLSRKAINSNAQAQMITNAGLKGAEAIVSPTIEVKQRGFLPFYRRVQVTAYGYVVEFTK